MLMASLIWEGSWRSDFARPPMMPNRKRREPGRSFQTYPVLQLRNGCGLFKPTAVKHGSGHRRFGLRLDER